MVRELKENLTEDLTLRVTANLKRSIQDVARLENTTVARLVRIALTKYLINEK